MRSLRLRLGRLSNGVIEEVDGPGGGSGGDGGRALMGEAFSLLDVLRALK